MRAVLVTQPGGPEQLHLGDVPDPQPGEQELVVDIRATALNRADLLQRRGKYPPPAGASDILGLECAGTVSQLGPRAALFRPGDRVMALLAGGGYAQRVAVDERLVLPLPESLSFEQGAAIPEAFLTAQEALLALGRLQPDDSALIHAAAGGVGSAAVQLARSQGARVFATAGSEPKLRLARELGAERAIDYRTEDFSRIARDATDQRGVDVVVDVVGRPYWEQHAECLAEGGRCVIVGVLGGSRTTVHFATLLKKRLQLLGLVMRSRSLHDKSALIRRFAREQLPLLREGRLRPVIDSVWPFADVVAAHQRMEQNANLGKIVLRVD